MPDIVLRHTIPRLAVGCMRWGSWGAKMDTPAMQHLVEGCLELGLNLFDHADIYGHYSTEKEFGRMLRDAPGLRSKILLLTKCGINMPSAIRPQYHIKSYDSSAEHILSSVEHALQQFHTDYLDILLLHRPDLLMDPLEIADVFTRLRHAGKVRAFGVSNFPPSTVRLLHAHFPELLFHQVEVSPLHTAAFRDSTLDTCLELGIRPMAWSPLAGGKATTLPELNAVLGSLAEQYVTAPETLLYAWLLRHPSAIIPVTGTSRLDRIRQAADARSITLSREDWYRIWSAVEGEVV